MSIEAMKQALEALENAISDDKPYILKSKEAITALRQAIEQAEKQEGWVLREVYFSEGEPISHREPQPVAWANKKGQFKVHKEANEIFKSTAIPFYAAPVHARPVVISNGGVATKTPSSFISPPKREWVGLTKDEVDSWELPDCPTLLEFCQFIEAKLKEKNT
jgi:hypothetical protein